MIDKPQLDAVYEYRPNRGSPARVRVKGFRGLSWVETDGVDDGRHRSISRKQLHEVPA